MKNINSDFENPTKPHNRIQTMRAETKKFRGIDDDDSCGD
jgi:hypothetical protein